MTDQTPGPAFNMAHANLLALRTGHSIDIATRFLEAEAEVEADGGDIAFKLGEHFGFEGLPLGRVVHTLQNEIFRIRREEAIAAGLFWTIRAALYERRAIMTIRNGVETEEVELAFISKYQDAAGILAHEVIGDYREAKIEAICLLTNIDDLTIRFLPNESA